jgi:hypothetical protein
MYRLAELGDCFLITFTVGSQISRLLIDCGSFRNGSDSVKRLERIVNDIKAETKGKPLEVVVGTHQHNDHLSGFVHCEQLFRKEIGVEEVWLSWLDDPGNRMAKGIGEEHQNLIEQLFTAHVSLQNSTHGNKGVRSLERLEDILGFYGAKGTATPPEIPAKAVTILKKLGKKGPKYLLPGHVLSIPGLPVESVRVYVLGPPQNTELLYRKDPRTGESYDHELAAAGLAASRLLDAAGNRHGKYSDAERDYPFSEKYKCKGQNVRTAEHNKILREYKRDEVSWRRIDEAWLEQAEALALYLDSFTNNSSLVLAFELVESGKVLLFAADAQVGNWVSWHEIKWNHGSVTTDDLLARTVFYKVGHHASHNATLVESLEKMNHPELIALIPVHKKDPNITKPNGWKMPARNLFKRLTEKAQNRVLQMDGVNPGSCDYRKNPAKLSWESIAIKPKITPLFIEVGIRG